MYSNNKISARQLKRMLILESIGISTLVSTEIAVHFAGRDGIFSIFLAGIMAYVYGWGILWICDKVNWNYWGYIRKYGGNLSKNVIAVFFIIKYLFLGCMALTVLSQVVKLQVMDELNHIVIFVTGLAVCLYGVLKGIEARGRLMEFIYVIMLLPIWVLIIFAFRGTDIYYITPLWLSSGRNIFLGAFVLFFLFAPIEMVLFLSDNLCSGDYKKVKEIKRGVYGGITYVLVVNLILFVLNVGHLGINTINQERISTIGLMKTISFSNYVLEKQSGIFLIFLITALLLTIMGILGQTVNLAWRVSERKNLVAVVSLVLLMGLGTFGIIHNVGRYENVMAAGTKRVEIENREYIDGILIDYREDKYQVILEFRTEENKGEYKEYTMKDISNIEQEYKKNSDKSLDYTNLQAIIFSKNVIGDDDITRQILNMFTRQQSIPENVNIYVAGSEIEEFQNLRDDVAIGSYLAKLTKHNLEYAITTFRDIKNVMNGTEEACILSCFSAREDKIEPDGISLIGIRGYICDYSEEDAGYIRMIYGNSGVYFTLSGDTFRIDKNKYYVSVKKAQDNCIHAKITYSGKLTPMSDSELTQEKINTLLEKVIQGRLTLLMKQYNLDFINIYKHMSAGDRQLWVLYNAYRQELYANMDIEVQAEYQVINPASH